MCLEKYPIKMEYFANNKYIQKYLECGSRAILLQRAKSLKINKDNEWEFSIPREHPLILLNREQNKKIAISCILKGKGKDISGHNIDLQVISCDTCDKIFEFHIDLKDPKAKVPEPLHHMHVLGLEIPRFPYPPMDIILLSEFVFINFFPKESEILRKDPGWKNLVIESQEIFTKPYFEKCQECLENDKETLLGHLINLK